MLTVCSPSQLSVKRALGVPSPFGTADVVRGHPDLLGREHKYARFGNSQHLVLDNVQIQGEEELWYGQVRHLQVPL